MTWHQNHVTLALASAEIFQPFFTKLGSSFEDKDRTFLALLKIFLDYKKKKSNYTKEIREVNCH